MSKGLQGLQGPMGQRGPAASIHDGFFGIYAPSTPLSVNSNTITTIPITFKSLVNLGTFVSSPDTFLTISGSIVLSRSDSTIPVKYRIILADSNTYPSPNSYEFEFDYYYGAEPGTSKNDIVPLNALIEPTSSTSFTLAIEPITTGSTTVNVVSSVLGAFVLPVSPTVVANANTIFNG